MDIPTPNQSGVLESGPGEGAPGRIDIFVNEWNREPLLSRILYARFAAALRKF